MKTFKKITVFILSIVIVLGYVFNFTGCSKDVTPSGNTANTYVTTKNTATEPPVSNTKRFTFQKYTPVDIGVPVEEYIDVYKDFVDALLAGEDTFHCDDFKKLEYAYESMYNGGFPLIKFVCDIVNYDLPGVHFSGTSYDEKTHQVTIKYEPDVEQDKKNFFKLANEFVELIENIINENIEEGDCDILKVLLLYNYISSNSDYDDDAAGNIYADRTPYRMLVERTGVCESFAKAFNYLLMQVGIDCKYITGLTTDNVPHAWSVISINDRYYHFDPTYENGWTGGDGFRCFGQTVEQRVEDGMTLPYVLGDYLFYLNDDEYDGTELCWGSDDLFYDLQQIKTNRQDPSIHQGLFFDLEVDRDNHEVLFYFLDNMNLEWIHYASWNYITYISKITNNIYDYYESSGFY